MNYLSDMECMWNLIGLVGLWFIFVFYWICFGICLFSGLLFMLCVDGLCSSLDIGEVIVGD